MADRHVSSSADPVRVKSSDCPCLADLIDFALGQTNATDQQRIETHLHDDQCVRCRSWVEKAAWQRGEPCPDRSSSPPRSAFSGPGLPSVSDATPIPPSTKFQRKVLGKLEEQLGEVEDYVKPA